MKRKKVITLPPYKGKMYSRLAMLHCDTKGLEPNPRRVNALVQKLAREDYLGSLTPNPCVKNNPFTPRIAKKTKRLDTFFGPGGVFQSRPGVIPLNKARELRRRFESAVINISHIYLETLADKLPSDMAYEKGASEEEMRAADTARFYRLYVWVAVSMTLKKVFEIRPAQIESYLDETVAPKTTGRDLLRSADLRERFVTRMMADMDKTMRPLGNLGAQLTALQKKAV